MTTILIPRVLHASTSRAHVSDRRGPRATHVFGPAHALAESPTRGYTLAGFPSGNLRGGRSDACA